MALTELGREQAQSRIGDVDDLAGHLQPTLLGDLDQQHFFFPGDVRDMHGPVVDRSHQEGGSHAPAFSMHNDRPILGPGIKMRHPQGHIIQAQLAERRIQIHLECGGLVRQTRAERGVVRPGSNILCIIAMRLLLRGMEGQRERVRIEDGWHRVWQGQ